MKVTYLCSLVFVLCCLFDKTLTDAQEITPIVIVPGIGGSQINAKLNKSSSKHIYCYKSSSDWFTIWLSIEELLPWAKDCWVENFKLQWNEENGRMENVPGVFTQCPDFGNTTAIEWLDPSVHGPGVYFYPLVNGLVKKFGYVRGKTLRAAPYDFRYDPGSADFYMLRLQNLIEETYKDNGNRKILLLSHSMGAPYTLHFLHGASQEWKDKYIKSWFTVSGTYAGSTKALKAYISGDGFGIPSVLDEPLMLRRFQKTFSSLFYIFPDPSFWPKDMVVVKTLNATYTINEYENLFQDLRDPISSKVLKSVPKSWNDTAPGIKVYCVHGTDVPTSEVLTYGDNFPDATPTITTGDGDGTVNHRSLEACKRWNGNSDVTYKTIKGASHNGILGDPKLLDFMKEALFE
ncbi:lysosomal phospholipase A and acyltransferase-like [Clytia hemisphaerica]|uniref:Uncharacterized protein n=1 Tax=Clytia hemisphaerica TaxID=252671 RepID=A0A7M5URZ8_9CNID|eukprot:TCONS_00002075-protein